MKTHPLPLLVATLLLTILLTAPPAAARSKYRNAFFKRYPNAVGTQLDNLPSREHHCGACHFDFEGAGTLNPYGLSLEILLLDDVRIRKALAQVENEDADGDGYSNLVEITDLENWPNTPTFPGLKETNVDNVELIDPADLVGFLTPSGSDDTTPPTLAVLAPVGGETWHPNTVESVQWAAADESGVASVDVFLSRDGGATWRQLSRGLPNSGAHPQFIPNQPSANSLIRLVATDQAGNTAEAISPAVFTVAKVTGGRVPTTLVDFDMPGTQPFESGELENPDKVCRSCHGDYDRHDENHFNWQGSMMGQAMRDPLYRATVVVAEQNVPASGDLCIRCHSPGGWQAGRSLDTSMAMLNETDFQGVQCDFCHRMVSPHYVEGVSPASDKRILAALSNPPLEPANGQFITDPDPVRRGPYGDTTPRHEWAQSDFFLSSDMCATCHDVSNPAFVAGETPGLYVPDVMDQTHPDGNKRNMFPVERTFSEWSVSTYAQGGVHQPQFAGNRPDGMVSTCQDCHMRRMSGLDASTDKTPRRDNLGLHDLTGGNTFVPDILPDFYPELDKDALQAGKERATAMLKLAATMELSLAAVDGQQYLQVRVTNETGHKLPSGYPEGRRAWLNVRMYDEHDALMFESGAYDGQTGDLTRDAAAKVYETKPGISSRLAAVIGLPAAPSFHFALNDTVYRDNRIPPRGFTNAAFVEVQSPPVGYVYDDGQYWDDTKYAVPAGVRRTEVTLYYQTTSREYIEFLRDENQTNSLGQELYDAWQKHGRSRPVVMAQGLLDLEHHRED